MAKRKSFKLTDRQTSAALYIIIGLLLCIFRSDLLNWVMTVIGITFIVVGIIKAVQSELIMGVVTAAIGVLIIIFGWKFIDLVFIILGIVLIAKGIIDLLSVSGKKRLIKIITPVITIIVAVALFACNWAQRLEMINWLLIIIGIILIIDGILLLIGKKR